MGVAVVAASNTSALMTSAPGCVINVAKPAPQYFLESAPADSFTLSFLESEGEGAAFGIASEYTSV